MAGTAVTLGACAGEAENGDASAAEVGTQAVASAMPMDTFEVAVDPSALPTTPLDREAFVEDVCSFAGADQVGAFFTFHDGPVTVEGDRGTYAGSECSWAMQGLDVLLEIQFSQLFASSTEEIALAGVPGVRRDASASTLENRARVQIPFRIAGSPVEVVVVQFHVRGVPPADEAALREAVDALGTNLVQRLGAGAFTS